LTKTGQPVLGSRIELDTIDGPRITVTVVAKFFGHGGNANLIGILVEAEDGGRADLVWPLERLSR